MITAAEAKRISDEGGILARIDEFCKSTDKEIEEAAKRGSNWVVWKGNYASWHSLNDRLKRIYEDRGFRFRRSEPIGGVPQTTVELYW